MRKFKTKYKVNKFIRTIVILMIVFLTIFFVNYLGSKITSKLIFITKSNIKVYNDKIISDYIDTNILRQDIVDELINIVSNSNQEIVAVNYNMSKAYQVMGDIANQVRRGMNNLKYGEFDNYHTNEDGMILFYPIGLASNNIYLNNLGYKIPIKVNLNKTILTGFKTKVSNYGINNALVELYLNIKITSNIISPTVIEDILDEYNVLISAKMVVGNVPNYLNGMIESQSGIKSN